MIPVSFRLTVLGSAWPQRNQMICEKSFKCPALSFFFVSFWFYFMCHIPPFIFVPLVVYPRWSFTSGSGFSYRGVMMCGGKKMASTWSFYARVVSLRGSPPNELWRRKKPHKHPVTFDVFFLLLSRLWCSTEMPLVKTDQSQWTKGSATQKQDISSYVPLF